jgi:hypothetical protein
MESCQQGGRRSWMLAVTLLSCSLPLYAVTGANYISNPGTNAVPGCNTTGQAATCANYATATGPNVVFFSSGIESTSWGGTAQAFADNSAAVGGAEVHREPPTVSRIGIGTFRVISPKGQPFIASGLSTYWEPPGDNIFDVRGCRTAIAEKAYAGWASTFNGNPYVWFASAITSADGAIPTIAGGFEAQPTGALKTRMRRP